MSEFDIILDNSQLNLYEVPSRVLRMYNLKMLYLEGNSIDLLPEDFFLKLYQLQWLDLRNNKLAAIPETIAHHEHLENLLLSNNQIEVLPNELGLVRKLKVLQVQNNPITYPNRKVLEKGTREICAYLKNNYERSQLRDVDEDEEEMVVIGHPNDFAINKSSMDFIPPRENASKITHKIQRDVSRISLTSSLHHNLLKNKVCDRFAIEKASLRQNWLNQLKILISEQERILQQEKNLKILSSWREEKKAEPVRRFRREEISEPPYGTYPECNRILSRDDLTKQIDRMIERSKSPPKQVNIDKLINELIGQFKDMETVYSDKRSSREEIQDAGDQINAIIAVHKKLLKLQETNDSY